MRYVGAIFLLVILYSLLPKVIRLEVKIEKSVILKIYFRIWIFYVKVFSYSFPSRKKNEKKQMTPKVSNQKKFKLSFKILLDTILKGLKFFFDVSRVEIKSAHIKLFCNDAAVLAILSGIIYSIRGILISCEQDAKIYYEGYFRDSGNGNNFFELKIEIKIFPLRILAKIDKIINIVRGVYKYGASN